MKLHRDLTINQRSAWFLAHRLRVALTQEGGLFAGPVEVDETYMGGKRANMSKSKREELTGRGAVGKTAIAGAKDLGYESGSRPGGRTHRQADRTRLRRRPRGP